MLILSYLFTSVQFSHSVMSDSLRSHGLLARQASQSITNSQSLLKLMSIVSVMPSSHLILCHPLLLLPSIFPSIWVFSMSQFFTSGGQSIGVSASTSVLPMNIQDWFPLAWTSPSRKDHTSVPSESHIQLLYGSGFFGYPYLICIYNLI